MSRSRPRSASSIPSHRSCTPQTVFSEGTEDVVVEDRPARIRNFPGASEVTSVRNFWKTYRVKSAQNPNGEDIITQYGSDRVKKGKKKIDPRDLTRAREMLEGEGQTRQPEPPPRRRRTPRRPVTARTRHQRSASRVGKRNKHAEDIAALIGRIYPPPPKRGVRYSKLEREHKRIMRGIDKHIGGELQRQGEVNIQLDEHSREILFPCKQCQKFLPRRKFDWFTLEECYHLCAYCEANPEIEEAKREKKTDYQDTFDLLQRIKNKRGGAPSSYAGSFVQLDLSRPSSRLEGEMSETTSAAPPHSPATSMLNALHLNPPRF